MERRLCIIKRAMRIVLTDNNDSFTHNLEHLIYTATAVSPCVVPYKELASVQPDAWDLLVISPGPGHPSEYPDYARLFSSEIPILGICMGMQIMNEYFGGTTSRSQECVHGKSEEIMMEGRVHVVARYHSLYVSNVGKGLLVTATNKDGVPMTIRHISRPLMGYQFHPESFLTQNGIWFITHALCFFGFNS